MSNIINKDMPNINEDVLYNSLCFLSFDNLLECLVSIGYENDIDSIGSSKSDLVNRLVNDARELGIEDFIQRLNFETITETCSLLSLSGVNGDTDEEILENSRSQLEDKMKKDSLDQFFYSLTPHMLSQFCNCLKINLPPSTNQDQQQQEQEDEENEENEKIGEEEEVVEETKTISTSIPSIKVGSDGTTVLSTLSTKSTYKKYKNRGIQYGDSIVEGVFYESIIRLIKNEILLCGVENLLSFNPKQKLQSICESFKINFKPTDKMSDLVLKITSKLFNINLANNQSIKQQQQQQQQQQQFITPIRTRGNNLNYPKTPSSASENEDIDNNNNNNIDDSNNINEDSANNTSSSNNNTPRSKNNNSGGISSNKNKRKFDEDSSNDNETTDDSEIDQPAKRPTIADIKIGITKSDLSCYLAKDLKNWLQKKGLKYSDKKTVLEDRILKFLEDQNATSASESESQENEETEEESDEGNNNNNNNHKNTPSKKLKSKH